jgi:hypothetical protein
MAKEYPKECSVIRAGIEIGSVRIKGTAALINPGMGQRCAVIAKKVTRTVPLMDDLFESLQPAQPTKAEKTNKEYRTKRPEWTLSSKMRLHTIRMLKEVAAELNAAIEASGIKGREVKFAAIGGEALRRMRDANPKQTAAFVKNVKRLTGIEMQIVDQTTEGKLGFLAATLVAGKDTPMNRITAIDIGGGSSQVTTYESHGQSEKKFNVYKDDFGSVVMKHFLIDQIKGDSARYTVSPNPIGSNRSKDAINFIKKKMSPISGMTPGLKAKIKKTTVYGISGVFNPGFEALKARRDLTDDAIILATVPEARIAMGPIDESIDSFLQGQSTQTKAQQNEEMRIFKRMEDETVWVQHDTGNLIMVIGYMKALGINEIFPLDVDVSDAVLEFNSLWQ